MSSRRSARRAVHSLGVGGDGAAAWRIACTDAARRAPSAGSAEGGVATIDSTAIASSRRSSSLQTTVLPEELDDEVVAVGIVRSRRGSSSAVSEEPGEAEEDESWRHGEHEVEVGEEAERRSGIPPRVRRSTARRGSASRAGGARTSATSPSRIHIHGRGNQRDSWLRRSASCALPARSGSASKSPSTSRPMCSKRGRCAGSRELEVPFGRRRPDLPDAVVRPRDPDDLTGRDRLALARRR